MFFPDGLFSFQGFAGPASLIPGLQLFFPFLPVLFQLFPGILLGLPALGQSLCLFQKPLAIVIVKHRQDLSCRFASLSLCLQVELEVVHIVDGFRHGTQVLIGQRLEGVAEDIIDYGGFEISGQFGCPELDQQIDHFPVLFRGLESEDLPVHIGHIISLPGEYLSAFSDAVFQFFPGKGDFFPHLLVQLEVHTYPPSVMEPEIPFSNGRPRRARMPIPTVQ